MGQSLQNVLDELHAIDFFDRQASECVCTWVLAFIAVHGNDVEHVCSWSCRLPVCALLLRSRRER